MKSFYAGPFFFTLFLLAGPVPAQPPDAAALFQQHCAFCHTNAADSRAPAPESLAQLSPEAIIRALTDGGAMRTQGYLLSGEQRRVLAEYLAGEPLRGQDLAALTNQCERAGSFSAPYDAPHWNGWGPDANNTHSQPAGHAGLPAEAIPRLTLQWAFGFQDASSAWSQPSVVDGRVFVGSQSGTVYSLDADTGCAHWAFAADSGVRTAVTIAPAGSSHVAIFGDMSGNLYAVDANSGELVWKQEIESHPLARITGSPTVHESIIYVPMSSFEESQGGWKNMVAAPFAAASALFPWMTARSCGRRGWSTSLRSGARNPTA